VALVEGVALAVLAALEQATERMEALVEMAALEEGEAKAGVVMVALLSVCL